MIPNLNIIITTSLQPLIFLVFLPLPCCSRGTRIRHVFSAVSRQYFGKRGYTIFFSYQPVSKPRFSKCDIIFKAHKTLKKVAQSVQNCLKLVLIVSEIKSGAKSARAKRLCDFKRNLKVDAIVGWDRGRCEVGL